MRKLRPYQHDAVDKILAYARIKSVGSVLAVGPTGCGKTTVGVEAALEIAQGGPVLWVAHREELVRQAAENLRSTGQPVGILAPWTRPDHAARVQVASVQTLLARRRLPPAAVLVWDEAHHVLAPAWTVLHEAYRAVGTFHLGLTATPARSDGLPMGDVYNRIVVIAQRSTLIRDGYLVPTVVYSPDRVVTGGIADEPVKLWLRHAPRSRTVVFCLTVEHADKVIEHFAANGARGAVVDADTPPRQRARLLRAFAAGKLDVIANCMILTEGWDLPAIETVILARPCASDSLYLQMVGRASRPAPGKKHSIVLDLVGATRRHGHPDENRRFSLKGRPIERERDDKMMHCRRCGYVGPRKGEGCPGCGVKVVTKPRRRCPRSFGLRLLRMSADELGRERQNYYDHLVDYARIHGKDAQWVRTRFRLKFGAEPVGLERS